MNLELLVEQVGGIARECGKVLAKESLRWREIPVEKKKGGDNPGTQVVTEIDRMLEVMLKDRLMALVSARDVGWLGEEGGDDGSRFQKPYFWCVDPLDGTQAFVAGKPGISISIALVTREGRSILGVVADPLGESLYQAIDEGGCWKNGERVEVITTGEIETFWDGTWQRHPMGMELKEYLLALGWNVSEVSGGAVMNVVSLLEAKRGCYFKLPKPVEGGGSIWDFAATDCLLREAGGVVVDIEGKPLSLNRRESSFMNSTGVFYASEPGFRETVVDWWKTQKSR
mgnify:CR=1 FL=1